MNSRQKGKRGERQWRDELRAHGYQARRGQQFSGTPDSPDVICPDLPWAHFEVKLVERLDLYAAMDQARRDADRLSPRSAISNEPSAGAKRLPIVAHRRSHSPWLVTMDAETFFRVLRSAPSGLSALSTQLSALSSRRPFNFQRSTFNPFGRSHCGTGDQNDRKQ